MLSPLAEEPQTSLPVHQRLESWLLGLGLGLVILGIGGGWTFINAHENRIYPGLRIDGSDVGGLSLDQARQVLAQKSNSLPNFTVTVAVDDIAISSSSAELGLAFDTTHSLDSAFQYARSGPWVRRVLQLVKLQFKPIDITTNLAFDDQKTSALLAELKPRVDSDSLEAHATLSISGVPTSLKLNAGKVGRELQVEETQNSIVPPSTVVTKTEDLSIQAKVASVGAELSDDQLKAARERATGFVKKQLVFKHEDLTLRLNDQDLIALLAFPEGTNPDAVTETLSQWHDRVTREPQNAVFEYDKTTLKVSKFVPPKNGLQLDLAQTERSLNEAVAELETKSEVTTLDKQLPVSVKAPDVTLANTNELGIQEQVGWGDSEYDHSIPSRIHNVSVTSTKINNTIVKPGEEFSFNKALGDVSAATGFQPAYVIKNGQTVLGDGGGVCQVSTTLFRAVLNAGLPVTKRKAHSYRVSYYELNQKPGLDATVYSGEVDLRFINDTAHHLLIHSEADSQDLYMKVELYGTSDGRTAEIVDHKTWDARPAPASVYITDPSLPPGKVKQIDWATGGIKASFKHVVKDKDGKLISEKEYTSNYIPWSAKYLRGP